MSTPSCAHAATRTPHRALTVAGIVAACILAVIAALYGAGCIFFSQRFWPNTRIGTTDVSLMTAVAASAALTSTAEAQTVDVSGQGVDFELTSAQAGLTFNIDDAVNEVLAAIPSWEWPAHILSDHDETAALQATLDTNVLASAIEVELATYNALASDPVDASLYYDEATGAYRIDPGAAGTKLDVASVVDDVVAALVAEQNSVALSEKDLVPQQVTADDASLVAVRDTANAYLRCSYTLTMGGQAVATLDAATVKAWLVFGEGGTVTIDDAQLVAWVDAIEARYDTVGTARTYTRPDGKVVSVSGGSYGWITDGAGIEQLVRDAVSAGAQGQAEIPLKQSAASVNPGGQEWGRYVDVDLTEQYVRFYAQDGSIIWESACISGKPDGHQTPTGVYAVTNMATGITLIGQTDPATGKPEYETYVQYWMPFVGNSVGLHDATWQSYWGSDSYLSNGSHGCVNLPYGAAESLFGILAIGDVVITHY